MVFLTHKSKFSTLLVGKCDVFYSHATPVKFTVLFLFSLLNTWEAIFNVDQNLKYNDQILGAPKREAQGISHPRVILRFHITTLSVMAKIPSLFPYSTGKDGAF